MNPEYLKNSLITICEQPRTFEYISKKMKGLDPVAITMVLAELEQRDLIVRRENYWETKKNENQPKLDFLPQDNYSFLKKHMGHFDFLETPHPLDFEWRNTTKSLDHLTELITSRHGINDHVLLLGMPTLFANVCNRDVPQYVTIIERNQPIVKALGRLSGTRKQVIRKDVFKAEPDIRKPYDGVYMDPPWYPEYFYQFVWLATQSLKIGGVLTISIPPINTRPNIDLERVELLSFCQSHGLCIESLLNEQLEYAMPFFEFNAFRAAGVSGVLPFWRKGDLITFRKVREVTVARPAFVLPKSSWVEEMVDGVRIRVDLNFNANESNAKDLDIDYIVEGGILPTVSSRDERRVLANVWTSGNRIFRTSNPKMFHEVLKKIDSPKPIQSPLNSFLREIVELEKREYNDYLQSVYYEMERQSN